jgi:hypothetical protein
MFSSSDQLSILLFVVGSISGVLLKMYSHLSLLIGWLIIGILLLIAFFVFTKGIVHKDSILRKDKNKGKIFWQIYKGVCEYIRQLRDLSKTYHAEGKLAGKAFFKDSRYVDMSLLK